MDRRALIARVRRVARRLEIATLTQSRFTRETGISQRQIERHFATWSDLCRSAGVLPGRPGLKPLTDDEIFRGMRDAFVAMGGIGVQSEFIKHFRHGKHLLRKRGWPWRAALAEFGAWAAENDPGFPYLDALPTVLPVPLGRVPRGTRAARQAGRRVAGSPLGFRCFVREPVNEAGVMMLFALVAAEFGFAIESVQPGFPDCWAMRSVGQGLWQPIRIEFEYLSRNFATHGHDPKGCDLLVCWEDTWGRDCPVPVFELKSKIRALAARDAARDAARFAGRTKLK